MRWLPSNLERIRLSIETLFGIVYWLPIVPYVDVSFADSDRLIGATNAPFDVVQSRVFDEFEDDDTNINLRTIL